MTTEQDQSTTEDRPDKATFSTTDRPIASGDGRSASFCCQRTGQPGNRRQQRFRTIHRRHRSAPHARLRRPDPSRSVAIDGRRGHGVRRVSGRHDARRRIRRAYRRPSHQLAGCFPLHRTDAAGHHGHRSYRARSVALGPRMAASCGKKSPRWPCLPDTALCGSYRRQSAV